MSAGSRLKLVAELQAEAAELAEECERLEGVLRRVIEQTLEDVKRGWLSCVDNRAETMMRHLRAINNYKTRRNTLLACAARIEEGDSK